MKNKAVVAPIKFAKIVMVIIKFVSVGEKQSASSKEEIKNLGIGNECSLIEF